MNTQPTPIGHSELIDRLVIDRQRAEELGRVEQLWLIPQTHQVVGFTCKGGFLGARKRSFTWNQIESIGADSIMVNFNTEVFADPPKPEEVYSLIGHEVWTEAGNKAGKIVDYLIIRQSGAVVNYLFASNGWRGILNVLYVLSLTDIASIGSKRLIVKNAAVETPQQYGSLQEKLSQVADVLKEDYQKTQTDLQALKRGMQDMALEAKQKAQEIARQLKEKKENTGNIGQENREDAALPPAAEVIQIKAELIKDESEEKQT